MGGNVRRECCTAEYVILRMGVGGAGVCWKILCQYGMMLWRVAVLFSAR